MTTYAPPPSAPLVMGYPKIEYQIERKAMTDNPDFHSLLQARNSLLTLTKDGIFCGTDMEDFTDEDYMSLI